MTVVLLGNEQVVTYTLMVYNICISRDNFFRKDTLDHVYVMLP